MNRIMFVVMCLCILLFFPGLNSKGNPIVIEAVCPNKVQYFYNEEATATVSLTNLTNQVQKGKVIAQEEWDLEESRVIWEGDVELPPKASKAISVKWNVGDVMYGRGLRVALTQGGREISSGIEFYQVADPKDWLRCFMINGDAYGNFNNHFAYAQSDFSHLAPQTNRWISGQAGYDIQKDDLIRKINEAREKGVRSGAYTQVPSGPAAWELARQRPEWFLRNAKGSFFDQWWWPLDPVKMAKGEPRIGPGPLYPDLSNPEVLQYGGDEIVRAIKMFTWDAFFFDGIYCIPPEREYGKIIYTWDQKVYNTPEQAQKGSAAIVRKIREIIRASYPDVALWYNGSIPSPGNPLNEARIESLKDVNCGVLKEIQGAQINNPNNTYHQWRNLYETFFDFRNSILKIKELNDPVLAVGYLYNMGMEYIMSKEEFAATRGTWTPCNHIGSFMTAARIHPCVTSEKGWRPTCQFMTRYSALLWSRDMKRMPNAVVRISVDSNREVWWEECVYTRQYKGFQDTLVHIVNSPDMEEVDFKATKDPVPAKMVEVGYEASGKPKRVKAWVIQPYDYDSPEKEPVQTALKTQVEGKKVYVELPPVMYHALVVFREAVK